MVKEESRYKLLDIPLKNESILGNRHKKRGVHFMFRCIFFLFTFNDFSVNCGIFLIKFHLKGCTIEVVPLPPSKDVMRKYKNCDNLTTVCLFTDFFVRCGTILKNV